MKEFTMPQGVYKVDDYNVILDGINAATDTADLREIFDCLTDHMAYGDYRKHERTQMHRLRHQAVVRIYELRDLRH